MGSSNLSKGITEDDKKRREKRKNPPSTEPGFEDGADADTADFVFDELDDDFGGMVDKEDAGGGEGGESDNGKSGDNKTSKSYSKFREEDKKDSNNTEENNEIQSKSAFSKLMSAIGGWLMELAIIYGKTVIKSLKMVRYKIADDFSGLGYKLCTFGAAFIVIGILCAIIFGMVLNLSIFYWHRMPAIWIISGGFLIIAGYSIMLTILYRIYRSGVIYKRTDNDVEGNKDTNTDGEEIAELESLFSEVINSKDTCNSSDDEDEEGIDMSDMIDEEGDEDDDEDDDITFEPVVKKEINYEEMIKDISSNQILNRKTLFDTFSKMLEGDDSKYNDMDEVGEDEEDFEAMEIKMIKALSSTLSKDEDEIKTALISMEENRFSYRLRMNRLKLNVQLDKFEKEIVNYIKMSYDDRSVTAKVDIEGEYYVIRITKGANLMSYLGDMLKVKEVSKFFLNEKTWLPVISGVDDYGNIKYGDAINYHTIAVIGMADSGKTWQVVSILAQLAMFNTPERVQFLIIDPKNSSMFSEIKLLPHVCGVHGSKNILRIIQDVIDREGERRIKLMADCKCERIQELWERGIVLPKLIIIVDEIISIQDDLGNEDWKVLQSRFKNIITRFPYVGINIFMIPHRAVSVIDTTTRAMFGYICAVRANNAGVEEALGVKNGKWNLPLEKRGEMAISTIDDKEPMKIRGAVLSGTNDGLKKFIINMAKAYYKMGVDIPDMSNIGIGYNRDDRAIERELRGEGKRVQYDTVFNNIKDSDINAVVKESMDSDNRDDEDLDGEFKFDSIDY